MRVIPAKSEDVSRSLDPAEIARFEAMAAQWWDPKGKFKPLHKFNPVRLRYIRDEVVMHYDLDLKRGKPFKGLRILDIGCGGGLLCEPMARLGAEIVGVDPGRANIETAKIHAEQSGLEIDYRCNSAEELAEAGEQFDIVLNMEVVEHVLDVDAFMAACAQMVKPGGLMFVATLNRTAKSFALAIIGAEYVLGWLPKGTHDWHKFLKPSEIGSKLSEAGLKQKALTGVSFSPFLNQWKLSSDADVNFMMQFEREKTVQ